jgi:hypothetical protein
VVLGESSGSNAEFYEARIRDVSIAFESSDYAANARPLNGLHLLTTATDNFVSDVTAWNMSGAGVVDDGGDNQFDKIHVYGFPLLTYYPNYAMDVLGNAHITHLTSDGVNTGGVHVRGNGNSVTNSTFQWPGGGQVSGAFPIVADAGTDYNVYRDNVVRSASGLQVSDVAAIFAKIGASYFPGNNTEIAGNVNYNDSSDGAFVAFYPQGFHVLGDVTPNAGYTFVTPFSGKPTIAVRVRTAGQTADLIDCLASDDVTKLCAIDTNGNATFAGVTAALTGNASTATALASTPSQCGSGQYASGIAASGNANCSQVGYSQVSGTPTVPTLLSSGTAHKWVSYIGASGTQQLTQPDAGDLTGLGNAATKNVGTTAGTVAAGDDSRFTCDVTKSPCRVAATSLTAQTASIGNTTLYTPASSGTYRVALALWTMATGSSGTVAFSLSANTGSGAETFGSSSLDLTKVNSGGQVSGQWNIHVAASQAISYTTTLTCSSCGSPQYGIDVVVERLQ